MLDFISGMRYYEDSLIDSINEEHSKAEQKAVERSTLEEISEVAQCTMLYFLKKSNVGKS